MSAPAYSIVTPAHNEAEYLPRVMAGVAAQTVKPAKWVIVDDRSTDDTWQLINAAAQSYPFIEPVQVLGGSERALGSNVVRIFNRGYARIEDDPAFVVKMDADTLLPPD